MVKMTMMTRLFQTLNQKVVMTIQYLVNMTISYKVKLTSISLDHYYQKIVCSNCRRSNPKIWVICTHLNLQCTHPFVMYCIRVGDCFSIEKLFLVLISLAELSFSYHWRYLVLVIISLL